MTDDRGTPAGAGRDTNRLEAFSDAVIAIAITLLVLEIHVPELDDDRSTTALWGALRHLWPEYLGYLISFLTIGIMWANHHEIFKHIARTDHYLILINSLFLLCIGFLPFPTALLSGSWATPRSGPRSSSTAASSWRPPSPISSSGGTRLAADV